MVGENHSLHRVAGFARICDPFLTPSPQEGDGLCRESQSFTSHRVKILKHLKIRDAWRFASVVKRSGRIVRDHVLITGHDEHYPEGAYYLAWYEHGERHGKAVSDFATVAEAARLKAFEVAG